MKTTTPYQNYYSKSYGNSRAIAVHEKGVFITRLGIDMPFSARENVLDIACGTGLLGKTFSNNVYGFDLNKESVKLAKKNGIKANLGNVEEKWKYKDNFFDIVIASHIIEHTVNPDHILQEAKRVLKRNGMIVIITPNLASWFNRILLLLGIQPLFTEVSTIDKTLGLKSLKILAQGKNPVGHLRVFTLGALHDIIKLHGFTILQTSGVEFGAFPPSLRIIDRFISKIPSFAASIIVVAKKN